MLEDRGRGDRDPLFLIQDSLYLKLILNTWDTEVFRLSLYFGGNSIGKLFVELIGKLGGWSRWGE